MIKTINQKRNKLFSKKSVCAVCIFLFVLFEPVLLCGCALARDEITMVLDNEVSAVQGSVDVEPADSDVAQESLSDVNISGTDTDEPPQVYIYVCGAVELPGVYCLRQGSRLYEAVELAGGLTAEADENCLNMARQITDGEQIMILTQEEALALKEAGAYPQPGLSKDDAQGMASQDSGLVNINTASVTELTTVSGIGESRAQAIVDYREKHGRFGSIDDIKKVDGIKDGLFSKIKDKITI